MCCYRASRVIFEIHGCPIFWYMKTQSIYLRCVPNVTVCKLKFELETGFSSCHYISLNLRSFTFTLFKKLNIFSIFCLYL